MTHRIARTFRLLVLLPLLAAPVCRAGDDFPPPDPAELALAAPTVEKDADAEVLEWRRKIDEWPGETRTNHALRIKVFTPRGQETQGKVEIPYADGNDVTGIAGRTVRPDGTVLTLAKDAVFDRTLVKADGVKVQVKSFALPGVVPGAILEYRWSDHRRYFRTSRERIELQRDIPVKKLVLSVHSVLEGEWTSEVSLRADGYQVKVPDFVKEKGGFETATFTDIPSFREEPQMPPDVFAKKSLLLYYATNWKSGELFWTDYAKRLQEEFESLTKPNRAVKDAAAGAVAGAASPEEKVRRLFDLVRKRVVNVSYRKDPAKERKRKPNDSPGDTLERGEGTASDVNFLFASLLRSAGLDPRLAALSDKLHGTISPEMTSAHLVRAFDVAVKLGEKWTLFDPGAAWVPYGMLPWEQEGQTAIVSDPKPKPLTWVRVPSSGAEASATKRTADLTIEEDGTAEGDVRIEETGHLAAIRRGADADSKEEREKLLREGLEKRFPGVEIRDAAFDEAKDAERPFTTTYHVRVPGFATRAGSSRLVIQPAFFQAGKPPLFSASARTLPIVFDYSRSEEDRVSLRFPQGFTAEAVDAPPPMTVKDLGGYEMTMARTDGGLTLHRAFRWSGMYAPASSYPQVKKVFDELHERDERRVTLRAAK